MRNASESSENGDGDIMRATFEVPRSLVAEFRKIAEARERTFSAELRKLMADEIAREQRQDDEPVAGRAA